MSTSDASTSRSWPRVKPVKRSLGHHFLTFVFTVCQPMLFAGLTTLKDSPMKAATRRHPPPPAPSCVPAPPPPPLALSPPTIIATAMSIACSQRHPDNVFIDALVSACCCRQHSRAFPAQTYVSASGHLHHRTRRRQPHGTARQLRQLHVRRHVARETPISHPGPLTRNECMRLVDPASETYSTQVKGMGCDSSTTLLSTPIVPSQHLKVAQQQQRRKTSLPHSPEPPTKLSLPPHLASDDYGSKAVVHLGEILRDRACTHERAFEAYSVLPSPGVSLLSQHDLRLLFHRMSVMEKKDRPSKLRYMSVVEDMKEASLPMIEAEWNSAIAFCGQCFARISAVDVREAYNTWQEMEQKAKVKSGHVTFTILFDLAAKAGKLLLAEEILKRMEARGLGFDRYGRASFMYYHGIKGDGQGVRRAWFDFLEAGEIPDTVVVNCLIASLIRAGEPAQAELVYERMKRVFSQHTGHALPRSDWREIRSLGRVLARSAVRHRNHLVEVEKSRNEQYLIPNVHTYAIFVEYYASSTGTGEILPVSAKLHEMRELGLEMDGRIFTKLFKGFANHGKKSYTKWTIDYLERVWASLLNLLNQETDVKVARWMVVWVIRAFETCADQHRTKEIWHELLKWWSPQPGELKMVLTVLKMQG